jgi:hypothetical protein
VREDFPKSVFRDPARSRPAIDYFEFFPTLIGRYNRRVAAAIKRESGGRALTMVHSGAVVASMRMSWGRQLQSNNNDLADLLDDPNIDMFIQAQPYNTRWAGEAVHLYVPEKSVELHGKLYLFDHDHRTLGCGFLRDGRHRSQYESEAVFRRDYAYQWIANAGAWIADMAYSRWPSFSSEWLPWYAMTEVARPIRETLATLGALNEPRRSVTEVAVVLSLNSPRYEDACRMGAHYKGLVNDFLFQKGLPFFGAPYDVILTSDLDHPNLPDYKLYLFLNPTYFTAAEKRAIGRLKRDGKVLAWFYAPGYVTDEGLSTAAVKEVSGIGLKANQEAFETPSLVFREGHPLSAGLGGETLKAVTWDVFEKGDLSPSRISPIFYADDPDLSPAGFYADGKIAYGVKDFGTWKSVWCGVPNFNLAALVRLARFAGVHLYAEAPVVLSADSRMLMIHNGYDGARTLRISLPRPAKVSDLFTGARIAEGMSFDLRLASPETKLLKWE